VAFALTAGAAAVPPPVTVTDEVGDAEDAPDIVTVVAASASGAFTFRVVFSGAPALTPGVEVVSVLLDADRDETTGPDGFEHAVRADASGGHLEAWRDAVWEPVAAAGLRSTYAPGVLSLTVPRAALGGSRATDFLVVASTGDLEVDGTADTAPELDQASLVLPTARRVDASLRPLPPRSGRSVALGPVQVVLSDGSRAPASIVVCSASVGGKALRSTGRCTWRLGRDAAGATLVVQVRAAWEGSQAPARTLRARVR